MKTTEVILKILKKLEDSLDENNIDFNDISAEALGITATKRGYILEMMAEAGLIQGITSVNGGNNRAALMVHIDNMKITLRGIIYLEENTATAKIIKAAKLLKDTIPGL